MIQRAIKRSLSIVAVCFIVVLTARQFEKEDYSLAFDDHDAAEAPIATQPEQTPQTLATKKTSSTPNKPQERTVKLINHMDDKSLVYKHATGNYKPKKFQLSVNKTDNAGLNEKKAFTKTTAQDVVVKDDVMYVEYDYLFQAWGTRRSGKRRVELAVAKGAQEVEIDFSFHEKDHIITKKNISILQIHDL